MQPMDLDYKSLVQLLKFYAPKGRTESASFLNWFFEHIYRLDEVEADDAICDQSNDKGIDGIYVDEINEEIHLFQSRIRTKAGATIGDSDLKTFAGSTEQFTTPEKIDAILAGNANKELKEIINKRNLKEKVKDGYKVVPVFVSNGKRDTNTDQYLAINKNLRLFDRNVIASSFVDVEGEGGIKGNFTFSIDQAPLHFPVSDIASIYIFPASAVDLVKLQGISLERKLSHSLHFGTNKKVSGKSNRFKPIGSFFASPQRPSMPARLGSE